MIIRWVFQQWKFDDFGNCKIWKIFRIFKIGNFWIFRIANSSSFSNRKFLEFYKSEIFGISQIWNFRILEFKNLDHSFPEYKSFLHKESNIIFLSLLVPSFSPDITFFYPAKNSANCFCQCKLLNKRVVKNTFTRYSPSNIRTVVESRFQFFSGVFCGRLDLSVDSYIFSISPLPR